MTIKQAIENGPNRFSRILGHATFDGIPVQIRVRVSDSFQAVAEYSDASCENNVWHKLGGNFSLAMPFGRFLDVIPYVARFELTPAVQEMLMTVGAN